MAASDDDAHGRPEQRRGTACFDESLVFCNHADRWHDRMIVGFLALIVSVVGLILTLVDLLALFG